VAKHGRAVTFHVFVESNASPWPFCRRVVAIPYPAELFAGSTRGHCGRPALAMPTTWMIAPSVTTPRSANQV